MFLNQAHAGQLPVRAWCFKITFVRTLVCVCFHPRAIKNRSCEMKPKQPINQALLLFSFFVRHLLSILLMGGALVSKHIVSNCKKEQGNAVRICCSLHGKNRLTSCTILTRHSSSVLKVGVPCRL